MSVRLLFCKAGGARVKFQAHFKHVFLVINYQKVCGKKLFTFSILINHSIDRQRPIILKVSTVLSTRRVNPVLDNIHIPFSFPGKCIVILVKGEQPLWISEDLCGGFIGVE